MVLGTEGGPVVPLFTPVKPSRQKQRNLRRTPEHQIQYPPSGEQLLSGCRDCEGYGSVQGSDLSLHHRNAGDEPCEPDDAITFTVPTRLLARFNIVMLVLAYSLVGSECVRARSSLRSEDGSHTSPISKWRVAEGHEVALREDIGAGSKIEATLQGGDICYMYGEELTTAENATRAHIVAPKNGWASYSFTSGNPRLELVDDKLPVSFCPLVASGTWYSDTSLLKQAPATLLVSQQLWNAAQVGQIFLLLCLFVTTSDFPVPRMIVSGTFIALAVIMPFSVYVTSPGGAIFATVALFTATVASLKGCDVRVTLMELPPRVFGSRMAHMKRSIVMHSLFKVEFIAFLCTLFSSMYNYHASRTRFPYWDRIFHSADGLFGLVSDTSIAVLDQSMYTMGLDVHMPLFVPISHGSTVGAHLFLVLWCWIPSLYVFYFAMMFVSSVRAPGRRVQQVLSTVGILHFLFLTDIVAYKFGRGVVNLGDEWIHWLERFCWRIAILLPVYQNVMTGHWKHGNRIGWVGRVLHHLLPIWAVLYLINDVLIRVGWSFYTFTNGTPRAYTRDLRLWSHCYVLVYHGVLVLQCVIYFCMVMGWSSCHHLFTGRLPSERSPHVTKSRDRILASNVNPG